MIVYRSAQKPQLKAQPRRLRVCRDIPLAFGHGRWAGARGRAGAGARSGGAAGQVGGRIMHDPDQEGRRNRGERAPDAPECRGGCRA